MAALLVLSVGYCTVGALRDLFVERERTVGTVYQLSEGRRSWALVSFATRSGERVTTEISYLDWPWDEPPVGKQVSVTYDPADPIGSASLPSHDDGYLPVGIVLFGVGLVGAVGGSWQLWRQWPSLRAEAEAWRERRPVRRLGARR